MSGESLDFILFSSLILLLVGAVLSVLNSLVSDTGSDTEKRIQKLLPGMNCGQCGFPGCQGYARALAAGEAPLTSCRPGGPDLVDALSQAMGVPAEHGEDYDEQLFTPRRVAFIHPSSCTGCGKCVRQCKADAIEGVLKQPHCIVSRNCIGCEDCLKSCPQECIEMVRLEPDPRHFNWEIKAVTTAGRR